MVITNFWGIYKKQNCCILCLVPELAKYFRYFLLIFNLELCFYLFFNICSASMTRQLIASCICIRQQFGIKVFQFLAPFLNKSLTPKLYISSCICWPTILTTLLSSRSITHDLEVKFCRPLWEKTSALLHTSNNLCFH